MPASPTFASRRRLLIGLGVAMLAPQMACGSNKSVRVLIDTSNVPELADWCAQLKTRVEGWWPVITTTLASPGYEAPDEVNIRFEDLEPANIGAFTRGNTITVNRADILLHQDDYGRVAHELTHVVQAFPEPNITWLTEGIADYLRYYVLLPNDPRRAFPADRVTYQIGYQPAAALLDWVERTHGAGSVRRVNAAMRTGGDGEMELFRITGATPFTLWRAYLKSL